MFSGIIQTIGKIKKIDRKNKILIVNSNFKNLSLGESISCSGICLTISKIQKDCFFCNVSTETIDKTNLISKRVGNELNLERSLKMNDPISGHLVFGHVDGTSIVNDVNYVGDSWVISFSAKKKITKFLISKCSISLDGISLTVNGVNEEGFDVTIIPHTWKNTTLKNYS